MAPADREAIAAGPSGAAAAGGTRDGEGNIWRSKWTDWRDESAGEQVSRSTCVCRCVERCQSKGSVFFTGSQARHVRRAGTRRLLRRIGT